MGGTLGTTEYTQTRKDIEAGAHLLRETRTLTGGPYLRGQVLGRITATGKLTTYSDAAVDGTEVARAVLLEDADGSAADVTALVAVAGEVIEANLTGLDAAAKVDLEIITGGQFVLR